MAIAEFNGRQKAAALLISLGTDLSAQVLKHFSDEEIERITAEIFNMKKVAPTIAEAVLEEAYHLALAQEYIAEGGLAYARDLLARTVGPQKAYELLQRLSAKLQRRPFDFVQGTDPTHLVSFIQNEHPQTVALIVAHLEPPLAAQVLARLVPDLQADVAVRLATMDRTAPEIVQELENLLRKKLSSVLTQGYSSAGGVDFLVKILNQVDRSTERTILESLDQADPTLADQVKKQMFIFDNIVLLDDRSIQRVLREVESKDLALALKGASQDVKGRILKNMSSRAGAMLQEEMVILGPVRLVAVEDAQQRIVNTIRRLEEAEEILIARGSEDAVVV